jgi:fructose-1,6-bisphosphatase I
MYPPDNNYPNGKLRLMYECNPMAMLMEAAGGKASNGEQRIMELIPTLLHERTALYIGNEDEVKMAESFIADEKEKEFQ